MGESANVKARDPIEHFLDMAAVLIVALGFGAAIYYGIKLAQTTGDSDGGSKQNAPRYSHLESGSR